MKKMKEKNGGFTVFLVVTFGDIFGDISFVYGVGVLGCFFGLMLINWSKKWRKKS